MAQVAKQTALVDEEVTVWVYEKSYTATIRIPKQGAHHHLSDTTVHAVIP